MTRKCALCKGTNYKQTYSFFSAPKDSEIRKRWQAVIPIANYTVTDETFVCSKHFRSTDIITHWVSGVPPHVVKIKYKKCRLRVGAVPCLNLESEDNVSVADAVDKAGRHDEIRAVQTDFLIPREKPVPLISVNSRVTDSGFNGSNETIQPQNKFGNYKVVSDQNNPHFSHTEYIGDDSSYKTYILHAEQIRDSVSSVEDKGIDQSEHYFDYNYPEIHKVNGHELKNDEGLQDNLGNNDNVKSQDNRICGDVYSDGSPMSHSVKMEQNVEVFNEELMIEDDDYATLDTEHIADIGNNGVDDNASESNHTVSNRQEFGERILAALQYKPDSKWDVGNLENPDAGLCDTMLFEDFLEIYTEVTLPRGWAFLVTSTGHATTVVYLYMNMPTNDIPVMKKEVYIKSDMVMRCGVGSREISPILHSLVKDGRNNKVHALSDIEELIDELDQRHICEGGPSVQNFKEIEMRLAYVDGIKWRHVRCPIIMNNGASKCSKCVGLNSIVAARRNSNVRDVIRKKEKEIESLRKSLTKIARRNKKLESITLSFKHRLKILLANPEKTIKNRIGSSNMPKIQKLMVNECLKASVYKNKNNVAYSETWIFLCLLLYVESPHMYRYIFVNNYMALPSMGTIKKYLNRITTNPQFYNLFQRSVEPYQPVSEQDEEEPT